METTVATLLLITAGVVFACLVIDYAVNVVEQTLNTSNIPQLNRIRGLENTILSETDNLYNGTQPQLPSEQSP